MRVEMGRRMRVHSIASPSLIIKVGGTTQEYPPSQAPLPQRTASLKCTTRRQASGDHCLLGIALRDRQRVTRRRQREQHVDGQLRPVRTMKTKIGGTPLLAATIVVIGELKIRIEPISGQGVNRHQILNRKMRRRTETLPQRCARLNPLKAPQPA